MSTKIMKKIKIKVTVNCSVFLLRMRRQWSQPTVRLFQQSSLGSSKSDLDWTFSSTLDLSIFLWKIIKTEIKVTMNYSIFLLLRMRWWWSQPTIRLFQQSQFAWPQKIILTDLSVLHHTFKTEYRYLYMGYTKTCIENSILFTQKWLYWIRHLIRVFHTMYWLSNLSWLVQKHNFIVMFITIKNKKCTVL